MCRTRRGEIVGDFRCSANLGDTRGWTASSRGDCGVVAQTIATAGGRECNTHDLTPSRATPRNAHDLTPARNPAQS
jgi:hypothetical protein